MGEETQVWLVGSSCSVADLSFLTWANVVDRIGIDLETEFPVRPFHDNLTQQEVQKWVDAMMFRPRTRMALSPEPKDE